MINDAENIRANELMRAGLVAYASGDHQQAHDLWRQVAAIRPHQEQVWLALLSVVNNEEDRRVCLENILYINPKNRQAQQQLRAIQARRSGEPHVPATLIMPAQAAEFSLWGIIRYTINLILTALFLVALFILGLVTGLLLDVL